jgi:hypothetical protein
MARSVSFGADVRNMNSGQDVTEFRGRKEHPWRYCIGPTQPPRQFTSAAAVSHTDKPGNREGACQHIGWH